MDPHAQAIFDFVKNDRDHGANVLAREMLSRIEVWVSNLDSLFLTELDELAQALAKCRPSMAPIYNCAERWHQQLQTLSPSVDVKQAVLEELSKVRTALLTANQAIAEHCLEMLKELPLAPSKPIPLKARATKDKICIFTHSYSSSVETLFKAMVGENMKFRVILTTSYPGLEGKALAEKLNGLKIGVTLIPDTQAALFMPEADLVIVGCDTCLADGFMVNKCGTHLLALSAKEQQKPFWFLADSFKHSQLKRSELKLEEMDTAELEAPSGDFILPRNIYFEPVPRSLYTGWIDELGVHTKIRKQT